MNHRPRLPIRISDDARADLFTAHSWYFERNPLAAASFVRQVDRLLARIQKFPALFPIIDMGLRRAPLERYPYCLFYRDTGDAIEIEACMHDHRDPEHLTSRRG